MKLLRTASTSIRSSVVARPTCNPSVKLVREFIEDCLYKKESGYFQKPTLQICGQHRPIQSFFGEDDYRESLAASYSEMDAQGRSTWHTPSVLFSPFYGQGVARFMLERHAQNRMRYDSTLPFIIYEVGGGNGQLANDILDYVRLIEPELYRKMEYHIIEVSEHLASQQRERLQLAGHGNISRIHSQSIFDWQKKEIRPCHVLLFEVLDNLAHDKLRFDPRSGEPQQAVLCERSLSFADAVLRSSHNHVERYVPLDDLLIKRYLEVCQLAGIEPLTLKLASFQHWVSRAVLQCRVWIGDKAATPSALSVTQLRQQGLAVKEDASFIEDDPEMYLAHFVPTRAVHLMETLHRQFPLSTLLLADFDSLNAQIPLGGPWAPCVQTRVEGSTILMQDYRQGVGQCDIFFPTDFTRLAAMLRVITSKRSDQIIVASHGHWCRQWIANEATRTRSGFDPVIEDYANMKVLYTL